MKDYESVAYRRRDHERNAMLTKVIGSVPGYAELLESAKEKASTLAAIPPEVYHWEGVEAFQDREAHATVKRALLDAQSGSAQCVVAHGMGGTGTQAHAPMSLLLSCTAERSVCCRVQGRRSALSMSARTSTSVHSSPDWRGSASDKRRSSRSCRRR